MSGGDGVWVKEGEKGSGKNRRNREKGQVKRERQTGGVKDMAGKTHPVEGGSECGRRTDLHR